MTKPRVYRRHIEGVMAKQCPGEKINGEGQPWRFLNYARSDTSHGFRYKVPNGYSYLDIEKHIDALYAACGAICEIDDHAGEITIRVYPDADTKTIMYDPAMLNMSKGRTVLVGFDKENEPVFHSFKIPHMLLAGMSGYGKTDLIRWILFQLINRFTPDELEIYIIDMKKFSFLPFMNLPHIKRVATTLKDAVAVLDESHQEMNKRAELVLEHGNRDITKTFKWRIVLIDEANPLSPKMNVDTKSKQLANMASQLAGQISCIGREAQVGLMFCTQYPTAEIIHGQIRANMESVICLKVENDVHSNVALNRSGAEKLMHEGQAIYKNRGTSIQIQVPYVGKDDVWESVLAPIIDKYKEATTNAPADEVGEEQREHFAELFGSENHVNVPSGENQLSWDWFPMEKSVQSTPRARRNRLDRGNAEPSSAITETVATLEQGEETTGG